MRIYGSLGTCRHDDRHKHAVNDGGYPTTSEKIHNFQFTNSTVVISYSEWEVISKTWQKTKLHADTETKRCYATTEL